MLPVIKFAPEVLESLWTAGVSGSAHIPFGASLVGSKYSPTHYLSVKITDFHINSHNPRSSLDYAIKLFQRDVLRLDIEKREFEFMLQSLMYKLDSYAEIEYLEPLDLCRAALSFASDGSKLYARCQLLFPSVNLQFVPILSLKIVSTALSILLTQKTNKKTKFQTGYLTLDQKKRVLPLLCSDPLAFRYPLVGVWAVGVPGNQPYPLTHPLVWASCVRFIESKLIKDRISPSPDQNTFLFVYFSSKPVFYEVSTQENPVWSIAKYSFEINEKVWSPEMCIFLKNKEGEVPASPKIISKKSRLSTSPSISSDGGIKEIQTRSVRSSIETCNGGNLTENLILEQSEMLKRLEKQIQELQAHMYLSPKNSKIQNSVSSPRMVNSSTNTTIDTKTPPNRTLEPEKRAVSTNSSFLSPKTDRKQLPPRFPGIPNLRLRTETSELNESSPKSSSSISNNPYTFRYSYSPETSLDSPRLQPALSARLSVRETSDVTISIPKIIYESSSDTSEDEDILQLQRKYLK